MSEFIPKTRKQMYEAIMADDKEHIPMNSEKTYYTLADGTEIKDIPLTFTNDNVIVYYNFPEDYIAIVGDMVPPAIVPEGTEIVFELNGEKLLLYSEVPQEDRKNGDKYAHMLPGKNNTGTLSVISIGSTAPVGEFSCSFYSLAEEYDMSKLAPKTREEKYLAAKAGLISPLDLPDPKTVDEYYQALDAGKVFRFNMSEFIPKTRSQMYKAIMADDKEHIPQVEHIAEKISGFIPAQDFTADRGREGWYISNEILGEISPGDHVYANELEIYPYVSNPSAEYLEGAICYDIPRDPGDPSFRLLCNFMPTSGIEYSVEGMVIEPDMSKLAPKTREEKYLAAKAGLISPLDLPDPKTVDEYYQKRNAK